MGIYQDEKGSKYLKLSEDKLCDSEDETEAIDLEQTDNESDGEDEDEAECL